MLLEPGQVAVVTGAASGIGRALATAAAQRGLAVVLLDVEAGPLETAAESIRSTTDATVDVATVDVTNAADVESVHRTVVERHSRVDLLCNVAGVIGPRVPTWEQRSQDWRWVLDVNLGGVVNGLAAFLPTMVAAGRGHIVNVASIAGLTPVSGGGNAPYAASKFAVVGLSETLAIELVAHSVGIGVTIVCPGPVATGIREAERNRPAEHTVHDRPMVTPVFDNGTPSLQADDVAAQIVDAVEQDRQWLIPSPGPTQDARDRVARLLADLAWSDQLR